MMDAATLIAKRLAVFEAWYGLSTDDMRAEVAAGKLSIDETTPDGRALGSWLLLSGCLLALQAPPPAEDPAVTSYLATLDPVVAAWLRARSS